MQNYLHNKRKTPTGKPPIVVRHFECTETWDPAFLLDLLPIVFGFIYAVKGVVPPVQHHKVSIIWLLRGSNQLFILYYPMLRYPIVRNMGYKMEPTLSPTRPPGTGHRLSLKPKLSVSVEKDFTDFPWVFKTRMIGA